MERALPKLKIIAESITEVEQVNNTCKKTILEKLKNNLPEEYKVVQSDPMFGKILSINDNNLGYSARLIHNMLCRQLVTKRKHEVWFVLGGRPLRFSLQEFQCVTGLDCAIRKEVIEEVELDGGFWSRLLQNKRKVTLRNILHVHLAAAKMKWKREDKIRLIYLCLIFGFIMARDEKTEA